MNTSTYQLTSCQISCYCSQSVQRSRWLLTKWTTLTLLDEDIQLVLTSCNEFSVWLIFLHQRHHVLCKNIWICITSAQQKSDRIQDVLFISMQKYPHSHFTPKRVIIVMPYTDINLNPNPNHNPNRNYMLSTYWLTNDKTQSLTELPPFC